MENFLKTQISHHKIKKNDMIKSPTQGHTTRYKQNWGQSSDFSLSFFSGLILLRGFFGMS